MNTEWLEKEGTSEDNMFGVCTCDRKWKVLDSFQLRKPFISAAALNQIEIGNMLRVHALF